MRRFAGSRPVPWTGAVDAASEEGLCKPGKRPYLAEGEGDHRHVCVSLHGVAACGGIPGRWFPRQRAAGL